MVMERKRRQQPTAVGCEVKNTSGYKGVAGSGQMLPGLRYGSKRPSSEEVSVLVS